MRAHLNDAAWFQYGSYTVFDKRAKEIVAGGRMFWIDDSSRTDLIQYPPAFPIWVATIYRVTGNSSPYAVQSVQWGLDLFLTLFLICGIAFTAFGWRTTVATGFLVGLSPLLAIVGVSPSADAPTNWFVLGGLCLLVLAAKRHSRQLALAAGLVLGAACWIRVNPLYLSIFWAAAVLVFVRAEWRKRTILAASIVLGATLIISPIVVRNYISFPDFTPLGGTIGVNLWEGLGETEFGRQNGFLFGDHLMVERERVRMGLPPDFPIGVMWPDGIKRERERTSESVRFILQHPLWYSTVMLHRMWGMLKVAGKPLPYYGTAGINVTSKKCLPAERQGGVLGFFVTVLGMIQSLSRYALLPLAAVGIWLAARRNWAVTWLLLATVIYYLGPGTAAHTEIRYVVSMHSLLPIFAGVTICSVLERLRSRRNLA